MPVDDGADISAECVDAGVQHRLEMQYGLGVLVVGKDVPWAVLTAVTLERAARLQSIAHTFGALQPIDAQLARELQPVKYRDEFVTEYWGAWQRQLERSGGGLGGDRA